MSAHTPGPWTLGRWRDEEVVLSGARWEEMGLIFGNHDDPTLAAQGRANALLIASAPDLLAALEAWYARWSEQDPHDDDYAQSLAREALSRARGEASV